MSIESGRYVIKNYDFYQEEISEHMQIDGLTEVYVHKVLEENVLIQELNTEKGEAVLRKMEKEKFKELTGTKYLHKAEEHRVIEK